MPDDVDTNGASTRTNSAATTLSVNAPTTAKQQQPNKSAKQRKRELKAQNTRGNDQLDSPALVSAITAAARMAAAASTPSSTAASSAAPTPVAKLDNRAKSAAIERSSANSRTNPSLPTNSSNKSNSFPRSTKKPPPPPKDINENAQTYNPALAASLAFKKSDQPKLVNNATSAAKAQKLFTDLGTTESAALDAAKSSSVVSSAMASVVTTPATDGSNSSRTAAMRSVASLSAHHLSDSEKDECSAAQKKSQMVNAAARNVGEHSTKTHRDDMHIGMHSKSDELDISSKTSLAAAKWMTEKSGKEKEKSKETTGSKVSAPNEERPNTALAAALKARTNAEEKEREREEAQVFAPIPVRHRPPAFVLEQSPPVHITSSILSDMSRRRSSSGAPPEIHSLSSDSSAFEDFPSNWASQNVSADSLLLAPEGPLQRKFKSPTGADGDSLTEARFTPIDAYPKRRSLDDRPAIRAAAMKANALMPHAVSSPTPPLGTAPGQQPRSKQKHSGLLGKLGHRKSNKNLREPTPQQSGGLKTTMRKEGRKRLFNEDKPWKHHRDARMVAELERKRYEGLWAANKGIHLPYMYYEPRAARDYDPANDVHGIVVRELWRRSHLSEDILERIWDLVDTHGNGCLDREEFLVGMWLVDQCLYGRKLPQVVDRNIWNSVARLSVQIKFHKGKH